MSERKLSETIGTYDIIFENEEIWFKNLISERIHELLENKMVMLNQKV